MSNPLSISLVTPTLNAGRFFGATLESVQAQGYENVEHIVADGGSTDDTLALARAASHGPTILDGTDTGIYDGMNRGLAAAQGEIVGILNADDRLAPDALVQVSQAFAGDPELDAVTGGCIMIDAAGKETSQLPWPRHRMTAASLLFGVPVINARFFRRSLLDRVGVFDPGMGLGADRELLWRVLAEKPKSQAIEAPLYLYRAHGGSSSLAGDSATRLRIWQEHLDLASRLLPGADRKRSQVLLCWRAFEGMKAVRHLQGIGDSDRAADIRRDLSETDRGWALKLPQALALGLKWRGRHSGY
ncbi:glycosyltransferase family 2 protein [Methyloligella solikamskensis]|uniref:Glycosyltransferase family 2 protein n=1 Tax=Methyloligella solikamskensis TaxID=1177756 RepID=A0ABW3JAG1_9HYPH